MIAAVVAELASVFSTTLIAASDDGGASARLLLLGPVGGGGVYFVAWRYYRNTHQSHAFERETRVEAQPVTGDDHKIKSITGTKKSGIDSDNHTDHRRRVQRLP